MHTKIMPPTLQYADQQPADFTLTVTMMKQIFNQEIG
jgi:hypothetical protein